MVKRSGTRFEFTGVIGFILYVIIFILDILIPRFVEESVAIIIADNGDYMPICREDQLRETDNYDKIVTLVTFNFFGFGLFPKLKQVK